ncbi:hypothetical protein [Acidicapsa acidisoli]|uniref:hypothetical protein n=1 Tax=Acidicapsa acidisoli TaxID=1615681 RepID=UPI0021DF6B3D|nr:hypothetical protein [Acidicapsa acidisoli]
MAVSLTETFHKLGCSLLERCRDAGDDLAQQLCATLEPMLSPGFRVGFVGVRGETGEVLMEPALLIYTTALAELEGAPQYVAPEAVAGVLHVTQSLNEASLADGYAPIGKIKALPGHDTDSIEGWHHVPVGMIVACDCDRPLEQLVDAIATLNASIPSTRWADAVSVLSLGLINYAVQFEGGKIGGDFILPNKTGAMQFAMYVHVVVSSPGTYTFNRTCGFLFMHLGCFSRKTSLPTNQMLMEGVPRIAVNIRAYMFDATDHLVPVPDEMRQDRGYGLQLMPYRVEDQKGKLLSRVQFVPWLGGAAIRVYGDLPLMPFIVLLGKMDRPPQQMKTPDGTISSILPIGRPQFEVMLARFNRQSNVIFKREQPSWTVTKMADEGTASPFMARLFLNILDLRKSALETKADIEAFEKPYELVLMSSITVRDLAREIGELLTDHRSKIERGVGIRIDGRTIHVDEPIDKDLRQLVESFLNSSNRVMLTGMKEAAKALQIDIGFFFKKESTFLNGVTALDGSDPYLANYCRKARTWSDMLNSVRNDMEHNFWSVPRVQYRIEEGRVVVIEPGIMARSVSDFTKFVTDRMLCFVEEICVHGLQRRMPDCISIAEVPLAQRPVERPERFRFRTAGGGMPLWNILYHDAAFDET